MSSRLGFRNLVSSSWYPAEYFLTSINLHWVFHKSIGTQLEGQCCVDTTYLDQWKWIFKKSGLVLYFVMLAPKVKSLMRPFEILLTFFTSLLSALLWKTPPFSALLILIKQSCHTLKYNKTNVYTITMDYTTIPLLPLGQLVFHFLTQAMGLKKFIVRLQIGCVQFFEHNFVSINILYGSSKII